MDGDAEGGIVVRWADGARSFVFVPATTGVRGLGFEPWKLHVALYFA